MFAASIRLRYTTEKKKNTFRIPGGPVGIWIAGLLGIGSSIFAIVIGMIPPDNMQISHVAWYEIVLVGGCVLFTIMPVVIYKLKK